MTKRGCMHSLSQPLNLQTPQQQQALAMITLQKISTFSLLSALILATAPQAASAESVKDLITEGKVSLALNYRFGFIDQANIERSGRSSTLQSVLGVRSGEVAGFSGYVEVRNVSYLGPDEINDTLNGRTEFPVEPDPESTEFQEAYLQYTGIKGTKITAGRRQLAFDNQRFISYLPWRQNQTSYDGATIESALTDKLDVTYSYAFNINRPFTDESPVGDFDGDFHLVNAKYDFGSVGALTGYAYILDMESDFALRLSTSTFGAQFKGGQKVSDRFSFNYLLEFAQQNDLGDNPVDASVQYVHIAPSFVLDGISITPGYELLGGNGDLGFSTPLALLHGFNGFADQFLATPADGLQDFYVTVKHKLKNEGALNGLTMYLSYHHFRSEVNGRRYGTEWNAFLAKKFGPVNVMARLAVYNADTFRSDVTKFWLQAGASF